MDINTLYQKAQEANQELQNAIKSSAISFVESARKLVGFTSKERLPYSKKTFVCQETGKTWNGRGRPPLWVVDMIKSSAHCDE